jgi:hypothetical protein
MTMIALSNEKFLTSRTDNGFVVLCDGHKLTRDDLTFGTARLIAICRAGSAARCAACSLALADDGNPPVALRIAGAYGA